LVDPARGRPVPVALYRPQRQPAPLILFSPGFGGSRTGYARLARHWASAGYVVAVVEHVGSNQDFLPPMRGMDRSERARYLLELLRSPQELEARPADLSFVADELLGLPWVRPGPVGAGGHSFGACTVLAAAGAPVSLPDGSQRCLGDGRVGAVVAMSPPPPGTFFTCEALGQVRAPTLLVTGDLDRGPFLETPAEARLEAYRCLPPGRRWLALLAGADHWTFADLGLRRHPYQQELAGLTTAFWDFALGGAPLERPPLSTLSLWQGD
ncbi:MAG TPA: hypothetical protein VNO81_10170, partial [Candidatus Nitrosotenuis sp.]|nr:hypothetical protein [Candidatus Nitrosotenuis sp.]